MSEDLHRALINAHRAGDTRAAQIIANRMRQAGSQPQQSLSIPNVAPPAPQPSGLDAYAQERAGNLMGGLEEFSSGKHVPGLLRGGKEFIDSGAHLAVRGAEALAPEGSQAQEWLGNERQRVVGMNEQAQAEYDQQRATNGETGFDGARLAGNVAAGLPMGIAGMAGKAYQGVKALGTGGLLGLMQPAKDDEDYWGEKAKQAGVGAAAGLGGQLVGRGLGRVISPKTAPAVAALRDEGVTTTPGATLGGAAQRVEEGLTSVPIVGDVIKSGQRRAVIQMNRAAFNRALKPIGAELPKGMVGNEAVDHTAKVLGDKYDDVLSKITVRPDRQMTDDLVKVINGVEDFYPDGKKKAGEVIMSKVGQYFKGGRMEGRAFKSLEEDLRKASERFAAGSPDDRAASDAVLDALEVMKDVAHRSAGKHASELQNINRGWANFIRVQKAAGAQRADGGIFSAEQLNAAVRAADKRKHKAGYARGQALLQDLSDDALETLGRKVPDSGTPFRAATGAGLLGYLADPSGLAVAGAAGSMLPYTRPGQFLTSGLLASRPSGAKAASDAVRRASPLLSATGLPPLLSNLPLPLSD